MLFQRIIKIVVYGADDRDVYPTHTIHLDQNVVSCLIARSLVWRTLGFIQRLANNAKSTYS